MALSAYRQHLDYFQQLLSVLEEDYAARRTNQASLYNPVEELEEMPQFTTQLLEIAKRLVTVPVSVQKVSLQRCLMDTANPLHRRFLTQLEAETVVISRATIVSNVIANFLRFLSLPLSTSATKYYLLINDEKIGSEAWLYSELLGHRKQLLSRVERTELENRFCEFLPTLTLIRSTEGATVVPSSCAILVDDFSLSGTNLIGTLDHFSSNCQQSHSVVVILSHTTARAEQSLRELPLSVRTFGEQTGQRYLPHLDSVEVLSTASIPVLDPTHTFSEVEREELAREFNPDYENWSAPFLTDYKVPNGAGSWPQVYEKCLPPRDRKFMKAVPNPYRSS